MYFNGIERFLEVHSLIKGWLVKIALVTVIFEQ